MIDEDNKKDELFKGFGNDKEPKSNSRVVVSIIAVIVVLGLFVFLAVMLTGTKNPTSLAVADLEQKEQAVQENQQLLESIGAGQEIQVSEQAEAEGQTAEQASSGTNTGSTSSQTTSAIQKTTLTNYGQAMSKVLELRTSSNTFDVIKTAEGVTDLDLYIKGLEDPRSLTTPWQKLIACVYSTCDDQVYISMIDAIAAEDLSNTDHSAVHSVIETYNYWDGKNTVLFSASLAKTNKIIVEKYSADIVSKWNEMIKCNGKCSNFDALLFDLIGSIVK